MVRFGSGASGFIFDFNACFFAATRVHVSDVIISTDWSIILITVVVVVVAVRVRRIRVRV